MNRIGLILPGYSLQGVKPVKSWLIFCDAPALALLNVYPRI
jgi:hypothetical protein